ncbi:MAG: hypothetical protein II998_11395 [Clostridia bacterium]|nr:hypothetical protein [Clostridia bacterium]
MKRIFLVIMVCMLIFCALPMSSSAYKIGDTIGYALTTDIVATINGYHIPSYNVDGYTYIVAEDLSYYGFSVNYDNYSRSLSVTRDYSQSWVSKSYVKPFVLASSVGNRAHNLLYTDIKTYLDRNYTPSYNINGQTIISFDALRAYGDVLYDNNKREISLTIAGLNTNLYSVDRQSVSILDTMSAPEKREVNIFLSNFSEAFYDPNNDYYTSFEEQKLSFAEIHLSLNSWNEVSYDYSNNYGYVVISAESVDRVLNRFFGSTIPHETPANSELWFYNNGKFYRPASSGESYTRFTIANSMYVNENGTYKVNFDIYYDSSLGGGAVLDDKTVYSLTPSQASLKYDYIGSGTAIVKPKVYNNSNTYELVDYNVVYDW